MTDSTDPDVDALRTELDQIKEAMGIQERYEGAAEQWLLFGVLVLAASGLSQYAFLRELPPTSHTAIWLVTLGVGGVIGSWLILGDDARPDYSPVRLLYGGPKPNVFLQFLFVYFATVPIQVLVAASVDLSDADRVVFGLALALVLLGVGYLVLGNAVKSYRIRFRDRAAFYVGGCWIAALGTALPHVEFLRTWGYATFGVCYFVYATATSAVLRGDGDD
jgi:hypothetical protein